MPRGENFEYEIKREYEELLQKIGSHDDLTVSEIKSDITDILSRLYGDEYSDMLKKLEHDRNTKSQLNLQKNGISVSTLKAIADGENNPPGLDLENQTAKQDLIQELKGVLDDFPKLQAKVKQDNVEISDLNNDPEVISEMEKFKTQISKNFNDSQGNNNNTIEGLKGIKQELKDLDSKLSLDTNLLFRNTAVSVFTLGLSALCFALIAGAFGPVGGGAFGLGLIFGTLFGGVGLNCADNAIKDVRRPSLNLLIEQGKQKANAQISTTAVSAYSLSPVSNNVEGNKSSQGKNNTRPSSIVDLNNDNNNTEGKSMTNN